METYLAIIGKMTMGETSTHEIKVCNSYYEAKDFLVGKGFYKSNPQNDKCKNFNSKDGVRASIVLL